MPSPALQRVNAFLSDFARRQAARATALPGGFAVYDDAFAQSYANNQVVIDAAVDPEALPSLAEEALGHLPHRLISVLDDETGQACAGPLIRAGYTHSTYLVMLHTGPVPDAGPAREVDLDALRAPLTRRWRGFLPDADDEVLRQLVDRREAQPARGGRRPIHRCPYGGGRGRRMGRSLRRPGDRHGPDRGPDHLGVPPPTRLRRRRLKPAPCAWPPPTAANSAS